MLAITLPREAYPRAAALRIPEAIHNYFSYRAKQAQQELRELMRIGWRALGIGLAVLTVCFATIRGLNIIAGPGAFIQFADQSLIILGWVANWRPLEIFLYDWWPIRRRYRLLRRLAEMPVEVRPVS
jgi:hypothetical protein